MNYRCCPRCQGSGVIPDARMKLSDDDVQDIRFRLAHGAKGIALAEMYGVSESRISAIRHHKERT